MGIIEDGGIYHPVISNRFRVRYIFDDSAHIALSVQTLRIDYDLTAKTLDIVIEMPLGSDEAMSDLIKFAQGKSKFGFTSNTCVVIDYLDGQTTNAANSIHCFIEEVVSTKISNDYAVSDETCKIYISCKVANFVPTQGAS